MINSGIAVNQGRDMSRRFVVRAEMFGQLTTGLEAAWNKLKGEGYFLHSVLLIEKYSRVN